MQIPITGSAYTNETQDANLQRLVNMYMTEAGPNGRGAGPNLPMPGLLSIHDFGGRSVRGMWYVNNLLIIVVDTSIYKCTINTTTLGVSVSLLGTLLEQTGIPRLSSNPLQFLMVNGSSNGYLYNYNTTGSVTPGTIGGTGGDTYTLTLNGTVVINGLPVSSALPVATLVADINDFTTTTGITATNAAGVVTLTANNDSPITVVETGTGFTFGTDGLTKTGGDFATGSMSSFIVINSSAPSTFPGGTDIVFMDGYFIVNAPNTNYLYSSNLNDGRTWNAANRTSASADPGTIVGLAIQKKELWVLGANRIEIYYDAANSPGFPFSPRDGMVMTIGCNSLSSIVTLDNGIMFLDSRNYIVQTQTSDYLVNTTSSYELKIISTIPLNKEFGAYQTTSDCVGMEFLQNGHLMAQFDFPTEKKTWCYDYSLGYWLERPYHDSSLEQFGSYLGQYSAQYQNLLLTGGRQSGKLYIMSPQYYDDNGEGIFRIRTVGPFNKEFDLITVDELRLRMTSGLASQSGLGSDPQISMRYSIDGGHTWSPSIAMSIGKVGEYAKMIVWPPLGMGREWFFEFTIVEPINFSLIDASARVTIEEGN
jgi:hypothetical protein